MKDPRDTGTPEIAKRLQVVPRFSGRVMTMRVMDETEIDRLLLHDRITSSEHSTLEGLMTRMRKANFVGIKSPTYDAPLSMDPSAVGDRRANQIRSMVKLFLALDRKIGPDKRKALVNLVLADHEWPGDDPSLKATVRSLAELL